MFIPLHDANTLKHVRLQYVTLGIILANVLAWLALSNTMYLPEANVNQFYYAFGFIPAVVNDLAELPPELVYLPAPISYVSYSFFHAGFMHLAGNMLFLWVFGDNVEDAMGHLRFFVFYLLCAAAGAFAHSLVFPEAEYPLIGASGAAAGVIAAYLLLHPKVRVWVLVFGRVPVRLSAMWVIGAWILYQAANLVWFSESEVSWAAHMGGVVAGLALIPLFKKRHIALFDREIVTPELPPVPAGAENPADKAETPKEPDPKKIQWGRRNTPE